MAKDGKRFLIPVRRVTGGAAPYGVDELDGAAAQVAFARREAWA